MKEDQERRLLYMADLGLKGGAYHAEFKIANPGITLKWVIRLVLLLLKPIMTIVTPTLRKELESFLVAYYKKAEETENPWDDFLALFLLNIFDVSVPE